MKRSNPTLEPAADDVVLKPGAYSKRELALIQQENSEDIGEKERHMMLSG